MIGEELIGWATFVIILGVLVITSILCILSVLVILITLYAKSIVKKRFDQLHKENLIKIEREVDEELNVR